MNSLSKRLGLTTFVVEGCYACHKVAEKPFIRPQVPVQPEANIINFDPEAKWP